MLDGEIRWDGAWFWGLITVIFAGLFFASTVMIDLTARISALEAQATPAPIEESHDG